MSDETEEPGGPEAPAPAAKRKRPGGRLAGESLGGMLAGFDQQIMRTQPPPHELVQKGSPVRGLSGEGDDLVIVLSGSPDDVVLDGEEGATPEVAPDGADAQGVTGD